MKPCFFDTLFRYSRRRAVVTRFVCANYLIVSAQGTPCRSFIHSAH